MLARLFERFDALVLPAAQVWPFPMEWRWPEAIAGRAMDTYHRWMEVVIPVSLVGLPAIARAGGVRGAGTADGDAGVRAEGERPAAAAAGAGLSPGDGLAGAETARAGVRAAPPGVSHA